MSTGTGLRSYAGESSHPSGKVLVDCDDEIAESLEVIDILGPIFFQFPFFSHSILPVGMRSTTD